LNEHAVARLFELDTEEDPCDHWCPALPDGWQETGQRGRALRWHGRLCREVDVSLEEAQATLAALVLMASERKGNAAFALADLLSRRGLERPCELLGAWARAD
jgi:hypothetical protein